MSRNPWAGYWSQGSVSSCLPNAERGFAPILDMVWKSYGRALPRGAEVLDLATGNGAVLRALIGTQVGLKLIGVDSAPVLAPAPPEIALKPGIAMERLPFEDGRFDALTSQFGLEYGDVPTIAREAARVLRPTGRFRFVIHHAAGPIVAHNGGRRAALAWARHDSGVLARAGQLARTRQMTRIPTPPSFRAAIEDARARFPDQSAAVEFCASVLQTLDMGAAHPPSETLEVLAELERRADGEIGRLDALAGAACDEAGIGEVVGHLRAAGLGAQDARPIKSGKTPFAWLIEGARI